MQNPAHRRLASLMLQYARRPGSVIHTSIPMSAPAATNRASAPRLQGWGGVAQGDCERSRSRSRRQSPPPETRPRRHDRAVERPDRQHRVRMTRCLASSRTIPTAPRLATRTAASNAPRRRSGAESGTAPTAGAASGVPVRAPPQSAPPGAADPACAPGRRRRSASPCSPPCAASRALATLKAFPRREPLPRTSATSSLSPSAAGPWCRSFSRGRSSGNRSFILHSSQLSAFSHQLSAPSAFSHQPCAAVHPADRRSVSTHSESVPIRGDSIGRQASA